LICSIREGEAAFCGGDTCQTGGKEALAMSLKRREFLKITGFAGASLLGARRTGANERDREFSAMLIDTTLCEGCRSCEEACNEKNRLPRPDVPFDEESVFENIRDTFPGAYTVVNRYPNPKDPKNPIYVRRQCMHCNQPACASACLVRGLEKTRMCRSSSTTALCPI
jgi:ferredoxin